MFKDTKHVEVFKCFREISDIPRGSGNEKAIADFLVEFAATRGLYCVRDDANNVFIRKAASSAELANTAPVVLQGHTDMVCEADAGIDHDFLKDPIEFIRNGDVLTANGTTLGADNGVALGVSIVIEVVFEVQLTVNIASYKCACNLNFNFICSSRFNGEICVSSKNF